MVMAQIRGIWAGNQGVGMDGLFMGSLREAESICILVGLFKGNGTNSAIIKLGSAQVP